MPAKAVGMAAPPDDDEVLPVAEARADEALDETDEALDEASDESDEARDEASCEADEAADEIDDVMEPAADEAELVAELAPLMALVTDELASLVAEAMAEVPVAARSPKMAVLVMRAETHEGVLPPASSDSRAEAAEAELVTKAWRTDEGMTEVRARLGEVSVMAEENLQTGTVYSQLAGVEVAKLGHGRGGETTEEEERLDLHFGKR